MAVDIEKLQGLALSSDEIRQLTGWGDAMTEDYLNILQNMLEIAEGGDATDLDVTDHIDNDLIHFTEASISHENIQGNGFYDHGVIDSHIDNYAYHYPQEAINHLLILNGGAYTHAEIDVAVEAQVPVGGIIMFNGTIADLPSRYQLCDGTNSTPDLSDKFIVGTTTQGNIGDTGDMADDTTPDGTFDYYTLAFIRRMS